MCHYDYRPEAEICYLNLCFLIASHSVRILSRDGTFWPNYYIICKSGFLDFVHRLYFNNITFRKLAGCWETNSFGFCPFLPEDGRRCSFRNVVILLKYKRLTKAKKNVFTDYNAPSSEPFRLKSVIVSVFSPIKCTLQSVLLISPKVFLFTLHSISYHIWFGNI
jgi:hypothetical protein